MPTPRRSIRVSDDQWKALMTHAETQGKNFTQWALETLQERMELERKIDKQRKERERRSQ